MFLRRKHSGWADISPASLIAAQHNIWAAKEGRMEGGKEGYKMLLRIENIEGKWTDQYI